MSFKDYFIIIILAFILIGCAVTSQYKVKSDILNEPQEIIGKDFEAKGWLKVTWKEESYPALRIRLLKHNDLISLKGYSPFGRLMLHFYMDQSGIILVFPRDKVAFLEKTGCLAQFIPNILFAPNKFVKRYILSNRRTEQIFIKRSIITHKLHGLNATFSICSDDKDGDLKLRVIWKDNDTIESIESLDLPVKVIYKSDNGTKNASEVVLTVKDIGSIDIRLTKFNAINTHITGQDDWHNMESPPSLEGFSVYKNRLRQFFP